jgi:hypothetical protein
MNNRVSTDPCAICGKPTVAECGPELFLAGTTALVCYACGRKYAPELVDALWEYRQRLLEANVRPDSLAVEDDDNLSLPF